jgi:hypothetical protein
LATTSTIANTNRGRLSRKGSMANAKMLRAFLLFSSAAFTFSVIVDAADSNGQHFLKTFLFHM